MRTAGIIGGLGPETSAKFYLEVVFSCFEEDKTNRPPMLIWNVPLPYKIEEEFITHAAGEEKYVPYLIDAARRLEKGGADFLVIPCNSVHLLIDKVRQAVRIPVLSIIDETVARLKTLGVTEVGVLATAATIRKRLYEDKLLENNISVVNPQQSDQDNMGRIINNLVHSRHAEEDKRELAAITERISEKGARTILLACTDLQLIAPQIDSVRILDTMNILADSTVREITRSR